MKILSCYALVGLLLGLLLYINACVAKKRHPERKSADRIILYVEHHLLSYVAFSALAWPLYIKWVIFD